MASKVVIVGDLFPVPTNFQRFSEGEIQDLFGDEIIGLFQSADYRICNLEGAMTDRPGFCEKTGPVLYAPTSTITAYKKLGIDCCTLANNHITDAGSIGALDTIKTLEEAGIHFIGAGQNVNCIRSHIFFRTGAYNVCLYNVAETMYNAPDEKKPGVHLYDEYTVCKEIESLKKESDYLIVIYHGGAEKFRFPTPEIQKRFHRMVDSGADMVLSQHTHCVGSEEFYHGGYLLYGQGNFLFRSFNNEYTDTGLLVEIVFDKNIEIKKHLVRAVSDRVRYEDRQDFTEFDRRSSVICDEKKVKELFDDYCLKELPLYLGAFKGRFPGYRIFRKFFPGVYRKYVLHGYSRPQMLFTLHTLRSEQNREIAINGIKAWLKLNERYN